MPVFQPPTATPQTADHCPGHIGHIELPLPVINSLFYQTLHRLLKITCIYCHKFRMADYCKTLFLMQQRLLDAGLINAAEEAGELAERKEEGEERKAGKKSRDRAGDIEMNQKLQQFGEARLAGAEEAKQKAKSGKKKKVQVEFYMVSISSTGWCW